MDPRVLTDGFLGYSMSIMKQYTVTGMSCAACQARVEKAVSKVPGVESCAVSLLTNSMGVEGSANPEDIIKAIENAGYGAAPKGAGFDTSNNSGKAHVTDAGEMGDYASIYAEEEAALEDRETPLLKKRLISSLVFLILLMYISMGHMMWHWPLPGFLAESHLAVGLAQMILAGIIMVINQRFFVSGFRGLIHRSPNMDSLVALGAAASFGWSVYILFRMAGAQGAGDEEALMAYMHDLYFESAGMILTLITVGKMLEARAKGKTTNALKSLMKLAPQTAVVLRDGVETEIPVNQVSVGDIFIVRPGENIPVDGVVVEGVSAVNEAALTGESIPVDKGEGDMVSAATTNEEGFLKCEAIRVGRDTTLSQIIKMVSDAAATKAPIAKIADRVSGVFVPVVIGIAILTLIVWLMVGQTAGYALARAISVLVISCPCALGLATPVAIMVGNGVGAKNGILFKTAVSLEETGKMDVVVLDKTGTITKGLPQVTDIVPSDGISSEELLTAAYALEKKSEHPLARAITTLVEAGATEFELENIDKSIDIIDFKAMPGNGLVGRLEDAGDTTLCGGKAAFVSEYGVIEDSLKAKAESLSRQGKTCIFFARGDKVLGLIAVADTIKEDSPKAIKELKDMGVKVVMLTGDNKITAEYIGEKVGVDRVIAEVLPEGKEQVIRSLQEGILDGNKAEKQLKVAMVGDGINDAPALIRADMGIAIGAGADVAVDAADVVLMNSRLEDVPAAIKLSKATLSNIHQNLFWAFIYNIIGIPLAAGVFIKTFGWTLNPMFGAAAMSLSSFCVVTNALRLNWVKLKGDKNNVSNIDNMCNNNTETDNISTETEREEKLMKKTMVIEGMMCKHCEATVKKALEELTGVESAEVSHEEGTAIVTASDDVTDEVLRKAVEDKEYEVKEIG